MIDDYPARQSLLTLSQSGAGLPSTRVFTDCFTRSDSFFSQSVAPKVAHAERETQGEQEKRGPPHFTNQVCASWHKGIVVPLPCEWAGGCVSQWWLGWHEGKRVRNLSCLCVFSPLVSLSSPRRLWKSSSWNLRSDTVAEVSEAVNPSCQRVLLPGYRMVRAARPLLLLLAFFLRADAESKPFSPALGGWTRMSGFVCSWHRAQGLWMGFFWK